MLPLMLTLNDRWAEKARRQHDLEVAITPLLVISLCAILHRIAFHRALQSTDVGCCAYRRGPQSTHGLREVKMSKRNGDRARADRQHNEKIHKRAHIRELRRRLEIK